MGVQGTIWKIQLKQSPAKLLALIQNCDSSFKTAHFSCSQQHVRFLFWHTDLKGNV